MEKVAEDVPAPFWTDTVQLNHVGITSLGVPQSVPFRGLNCKPAGSVPLRYQPPGFERASRPSTPASGSLEDDTVVRTPKLLFAPDPQQATEALFNTAHTVLLSAANEVGRTPLPNTTSVGEVRSAPSLWPASSPQQTVVPVPSNAQDVSYERVKALYRAEP